MKRNQQHQRQQPTGNAGNPNQEGNQEPPQIEEETGKRLAEQQPEWKMKTDTKNEQAAPEQDKNGQSDEPVDKGL